MLLRALPTMSMYQTTKAKGTRKNARHWLVTMESASLTATRSPMIMTKLTAKTPTASASAELRPYCSRTSSTSPLRESRPMRAETERTLHSTGMEKQHDPAYAVSEGGPGDGCGEHGGGVEIGCPGHHAAHERISAAVLLRRRKRLERRNEKMGHAP